MNTIKYFLILFFGTVISYGQQMPTVLPPSPEASAAFKFTEMPVSLYTGLPNISIPLFEIESGGVTLPISISYHARGVQVAEIAPRVGMGWTLNCGGMVTKQVRDNDDALGEGCLDLSTFYNSEQERIEVMGQSIYMAGYQCDFIPDLYSFSANGLSGKIMKDLIGGGWVTQQYSNNIVTSVSEDNQLLPLDITDGNGNRYLFGETNKSDFDIVSYNRVIHVNGTYTQTAPEGVNAFPNINTWHLTRIKTAKGPEIEFYYSKEITYHTKRSKDQATFTGVDSYTSFTKSEQQRLDSVSFDKGKLKFEYSTTPREDMPGSYSLSKITLYNKAGQKVKQAIFGYDYTVSDDYNNINNILAMDSIAYKRLFLKSVQFADKDGNTLPPYQFEYNPIVLPSRHSNSVDVWGYYNGKNSGNFLEPYYDDRSVDAEKVQAGLLQTIIKPEGGSTNLYYEPNLAVNVFPNTVSFGNPNPSNKREHFLGNLLWNQTYKEPDTQIETPYFNGSRTFSKIFRISDFQIGLIKYNLEGSGVSSCPCPGSSTTNCTNCRYTVNIQKWNPETNTYQNHQILLPGQQITINLEPGKYKMVVTYTGSDTYTPTNVMGDQFFSAYITWNEEISSTFLQELITPIEASCTNENYSGNKIVYAAGNRIRKIEYKENANANTALVKTYSYVNPENGQTSGRILGLTNFVGLTEQTLNGQPLNAETDPWGSGGGSPFSTYQGNSVGYKYVTEYFGEGDNTIGKTEYQYSMIYDTGRYYEFPYHPPTDNEWLRGKELNVTVYKKQGNSYQMIRKTQNTYLLADSMELASLPTQSICDHPLFKPSVRIPITQNMPQNGGYAKNKRYHTIPAPMIPVRLPNDPIVGADPTGYKTYYMTGGTLDLKKSVTTEYFDDGNEIVNTSNYTYRYDNHYNVAQQSSVTSDDATYLISKYFYPSDPEMATKSARADLIAKNLQVPLITQSFRGGTKLSETETVFKNWNTAVNILEPEYIKTAKGDVAAEDRLQYVKRDPVNGNIQEVKQTNGISTSYIWGYDGLYPIAKIENATYSSLGSYPAALQSVSNNGNLTQASFTTLRNAFPNAMITTYTYKPLVGVTSITDTKGYTIHYTYDPFGRLESVKDKDGNLLSENQYNYRP